MKKTFYTFIGAFAFFLLLEAATVIAVDPYFHYHAPLKDLFYTLDNQRAQTRGMAKFFDYDAIITGTSLTEQFYTSEFDSFFGTNSAKFPFSGATFYETEQMLESAFRSGNEIRYVLRSLDVNHLTDESKSLREDLGDYPYYLYNDKWWDDYRYLLNEDVLLGYCVPTLAGFIEGVPGGHTSFDDYMRSGGGGAKWFFSEEPFDSSGIEEIPLSNEEKNRLIENVRTNIVDIANAHPDTTFIYFIPPYNTEFWMGNVKEGKVGCVCDEIRITMRLLLECENIKLYCFTNRTDITTDLNNYIDGYHYVESINSMILQWIAEDEDFITWENYAEYVDTMEDFYKNYKYYIIGFE